MKKMLLSILSVSVLGGIYFFNSSVSASEENTISNTDPTINYYYHAETEVGPDRMDSEDFVAPTQFTVNHYVDPGAGQYVHFMQETYFNIDLGFRFYPEDHYYPFEKFTEIDGQSYNDLDSDASFWIDSSYTGPTTVNYYYNAELNLGTMDVEEFSTPAQLTVNHYVDPGIQSYTLFMQEKYFNTKLGFRFYPGDHYYPFEKFTETTGQPYNDLDSDASFWFDKY